VNRINDEESLNSSNAKFLSVVVIDNSYAVQSELEASSEVASRMD